MNGRNWCLTILGAVVVTAIAATARADGTNAASGLPVITVTAQKIPAAERLVPASVTAVSGKTLSDADVRTVKDAAICAPNVNIAEFTARQLSLPYFRGIGSSPGNPAVTTCLDGVPQLHGYSANIELLDVEQVEFVRGSQGLFYGRNTVGGALNVLSRPPSETWSGTFDAGCGSYGARQGRFSASGPLSPDRLGFSVSGGYSARDGYTKNDVTGHALDNREAGFGKLQLRWTPADRWFVRLVLSAERDRDGDYALGDLAAIRDRPRHVERDFEGYVHRDLLAPTLIARRLGDRWELTSTSGFVRWQTREATDLDYTAFPAVTREASQDDSQFTQEIRLASPDGDPCVLSERLKMKWQTGVFFFTQRYRESGVNQYAPYVMDPAMDFPVSQTSPEARLDDVGVGAYAQATLMAWKKFDVGAGARYDRESKDANIRTFFTPAIAPETVVNDSRAFSQVSPQISLAWHMDADRTAYATAGRGYRAGGFNPVSPAGNETYGEETSWNYEIGAKTSWLDNRISVNAAVFYISWQDLQLNLPVGRNHYVGNAGDAQSNGFELEMRARPAPNWDIFGAFGFTDARFLAGASSIHTDASGSSETLDVGGNRLIYAPEFTLNAGVQRTWNISRHTAVYARAEATGYGRYFYSAANTASQDPYWLANFRAGVRGRDWFVEGWVKNAFDTEYVPVAFEFPNGQSEFIGENGPPATVGARAGLNF